MKYLPRLSDKQLQERLEAFGAILIEGPKWTGKTTTAMQHAKSVIKLQDPDKADEYLETASTMPSLLLKGEKPRLIDEWQDAPKLWDAVRLSVDNSGGLPGQYILTGSNTVDKTKIRHTGTGRITRMKPDTRLVEYIQRTDKRGTERGSEVDALTLAARKRRRQAVECEIFQPYIHQEAQSIVNFFQQSVGHGTVVFIELQILKPLAQR